MRLSIHMLFQTHASNGFEPIRTRSSFRERCSDVLTSVPVAVACVSKAVPAALTRLYKAVPVDVTHLSRCVC